MWFFKGKKGNTPYYYRTLYNWVKFLGKCSLKKEIWEDLYCKTLLAAWTTSCRLDVVNWTAKTQSDTAKDKCAITRS